MNESARGRTYATLGGGCFWCLEAVYQEVVGVDEVVSGYAGGHVDNPDYRSVCAGTTGHAEVVRVRFDPEVVSYADLLRVFFVIHDPTTLNRQGYDRGTQYRSFIQTHSPQQAEDARAVMQEVRDAGLYDDPLTTEVAEDGPVLSGRARTPRLFPSQSDPAVLPGGRGAEGGEVAEGLR